MNICNAADFLFLSEKNYHVGVLQEFILPRGTPGAPVFNSEYCHCPFLIPGQGAPFCPCDRYFFSLSCVCSSPDLIQAVWSPHRCVVDMRVNRSRMDSQKTTVINIAALFPPTSPSTCDGLLFLFLVVHSRRFTSVQLPLMVLPGLAKWSSSPK